MAIDFFVNFDILFYRLVPSPSRFEIRQYKSYSEGNHFAQAAILNILHKICDTSFTLDTQDCPGREEGIVPCRII